MSGVYFLIKNNVIVYIGKTRHWTDRFFAHKTRFGIDFDKGRLIEYPDDKIDEMEKVWIQYFKPIFNKYGKHDPKFKSKIIVKSYKKRMKFRKMTEKSIIQFGFYRQLTVGRLFEIKPMELCQYYFNLSHITFMDDILDKLKITPEWRIAKPGSDRHKFFEFRKINYPEMETKSQDNFNRKIVFDAKRVLKNITLGNKSKNYMRNFNQR